MVTIIHGDNQLVSRENFLRIRQATTGEKKHFEEGENLFMEFKSAAIATSIFGDPLAVSASFLKAPTVDYDFSFLTKVPKENQIIIWCGEVLKQKSGLLMVAKDNNFQVINLSKKKDGLVFDVVDTLCSRNYKNSIYAVKTIMDVGGSALDLIAPLSYGVRNMIAVKANAALIKELHPFVLQKAQKFSRNFTLDELKMIYQEVLEIDYKVKSGQIDDDLCIFNDLLELFYVLPVHL